MLSFDFKSRNVSKMTLHKLITFEIYNCILFTIITFFSIKTNINLVDVQNRYF